eukprot:CAMPEP_0119314026 /NCGR_PEP_ID=MMETSP1333-20130426/31340_1 /TAXON_ID=418940 /ORGANISM="Scyphosphaera apsteinii, Strain RCC1455" /LENGTH=367 /DNA_ID=CAMNT_0007319039 /DNA_START=196 /DNA_END=1299 /DNA_ORIENTATION=+
MQRDPDQKASSSLELEAAELRQKASKLADTVRDINSRDVFRNLADSIVSGKATSNALSALGEAAQKAAGQTDDEIAAIRNPAPTGVPQPLPDSFEDSVSMTAAACKEAFADGLNKIVIEFDTSAGDETYTLLSNTLKLLQPLLPLFISSGTLIPLDDDAGELGGAGGARDTAEVISTSPIVQLLFPDEGTAAFVKQKWSLPPNTICSSMGRAQLVEGADALLLVAPGATEVEAVQRLLKQAAERAPMMPLLMINPKLVSMQSTGYGLVGRELRNLVSTQFEVALCLRTMPGGALFRTYPGDYTVWREDSLAMGGYVSTYAGRARPNPDDIDDLLIDNRGEDGKPDVAGGAGGMFTGLAKFIKGFQAL